MLADHTLGSRLKSPSVSYGAQNLYAHGIYEEETRPNLALPVASLLPKGESSWVLTVNDKKLHAPMRVQLRLTGGSAAMAL